MKEVLVVLYYPQCARNVVNIPYTCVGKNDEMVMIVYFLSCSIALVFFVFISLTVDKNTIPYSKHI